MFANPGGKIKTLAWAVLILGLAATAVKAVTLLSVAGVTAGVWFGAIAAGAAASWAAALLLYGFGELIEHAEASRMALEALARGQQPADKPLPAYKPSNSKLSLAEVADKRACKDGGQHR